MVTEYWLKGLMIIRKYWLNVNQCFVTMINSFLSFIKQDDLVKLLGEGKQSIWRSFVWFYLPENASISLPTHICWLLNYSWHQGKIGHFFKHRLFLLTCNKYGYSKNASKVISDSYILYTVIWINMVHLNIKTTEHCTILRTIISLSDLCCNYAITDSG